MKTNETKKKHELQPAKLAANKEESKEESKEEVLNILKENNRLHLRRFFPYLKTEYRTIEQSELSKIETLKALFGENETDIKKLTVIFAYQNLI